MKIIRNFFHFKHFLYSSHCFPTVGGMPEPFIPLANFSYEFISFFFSFQVTNCVNLYIFFKLQLSYYFTKTKDLRHLHYKIFIRIPGISIIYKDKIDLQLRKQFNNKTIHTHKHTHTQYTYMYRQYWQYLEEIIFKNHALKPTAFSTLNMMG